MNIYSQWKNFSEKDSYGEDFSDEDFWKLEQEEDLDILWEKIKELPPVQWEWFYPAPEEDKD